tara:strand:+ start:358 stop:579 length:222 start_codon:yes stop_codon:yes gene_type:complete
MTTETHAIECWNCLQTHVIEVSSEGYAEWQGGELIQEALPELSAGERELLMSGTCDPCWDELFGDFAEEEDND